MVIAEGDGVERMLTGLLEASHLASIEQVPDLLAEHAPHAGLGEVLVYLADLQQTVLRLLTGRGDSDGAGADPQTAELKIDGTLAGRAYQSVRIHAKEGPDGQAEYWWVPLLDGTERLGVLRVRVAETDGDEISMTARMRHLASLVALMVVSSQPYSDSHARLVRTRPMNVAAEMQWNLMPPLTFTNASVTISAVLEPAYEIGGDAFDYAIAGDVVHLAIFDAMGHDVAAGLAANLAMASCRNQRRQGVALADISQGIERTLLREFGQDNRFVTAIMADLDTATGLLSWINRGHHPPVLLRGGRWATRLPCPPSHPMGADLGRPVTVCTEQLEPGDRVLLYTDGITEAENRHGEEFGLQRFVDFVIRHNADGLPVPETLRRLTHAVLTYHDGSLQDDATVLLLQWNGVPQSQRAGTSPVV
ncbi:PP2C family protein-serine/threonine phosphatase [Spirillospora sp. NPDC047279]|uniref:PP2C family protein-serine/threonine phosphatase n=1 Tax=Spirillospora sp. NPDC047279 TaxID=3155478 RepID=UPI0033D374B3